MAPTNMSIQPGSSRPPMKQEGHPDHNVPPSEYNGDELPASSFDRKESPKGSRAGPDSKVEKVGE